MEIALFATVFGAVTLSLLIASLFSSPSSSARPRTPRFIPMRDLPEGEMHPFELLILASLLGAFTVVISSALPF